MNPSASTSSPSNPAEIAPVPIDADLLCGHCGQNLRGVSSDRCPECGRGFDRARVLDTVVPWELRRQIGRFRAYWRTVRLVTFQSGRLANADVTLGAARAFRRWTMGMLFVTIVLPALVWIRREATIGTPRGIRTSGGITLGPQPDYLRNPWGFGVVVITFLLWFLAIPRIPAWFSYSRRLSVAEQRRAVALSWYACAPLAWIPPLALLFGIFGGVQQISWETPLLFYVVGAIALTLAILIAITPLIWWWITLRLIGRVTASHVRAILAGILLPALWVLLAALLFVSLLFIVNYGALLIHSLT